MNAHRVEYLVVGGYAVVHYGYERATKDLDVWIAVDAVNAERVSLALQAFGGFAPSRVPAKMFLRPDTVHAFGREPVRIDILPQADGVTFQECYARRITADWDGCPVSLISLADLRANKLASGRPRDMNDLLRLPDAEPSQPSPPERRRPKRRRSS